MCWGLSDSYSRVDLSVGDRGFRFVLALIQFGLEPLGAKLTQSPQEPSEE
jgi:hypothetical protein